MIRRWVSKKTAKVMLGSSILLLVLSAGVTFCFKNIYDAILNKCIVLEKGTPFSKLWQDIPLPIYEKFYFFNITNTELFLNGIEPLSVKEIGPYTYEARWVKYNPLWNLNHTVSFRETRTYHFVPDLSIGSEEDVIYTLNAPMVIGANVVPESLRTYLDFYCLLKGDKVVIKKSIRELVYGGYDDAILNLAPILNLDLPYKDGKFAWFYGQNASNDGVFTVFTGADDEAKTNFINNWNGQEMLHFWSSGSCNMLNGTNIETGPPIRGSQDSYTFFQSLFCRSLTFNYTNDTVHFGLDSKRFRPTYELLANSTENPDNYCFEVNKERASGVLDISSCHFGSPILISFPHFYLADSSYLYSVNGLDPNDDKHGSYIDVEPITGVTIELTIRVQVNVEIQKIPDFYFFDDVSKGVLPVFWVEFNVKIDEYYANFIKWYTTQSKIIGYALLGLLQFSSWIGGVFAVITLWAYRTVDTANPSKTINGEILQSESNIRKQNNGINSDKNADNTEDDRSSVLIFRNEDSEIYKTKL